MGTAYANKIKVKRVMCASAKIISMLIMRTVSATPRSLFTIILIVFVRLMQVKLIILVYVGRILLNLGHNACVIKMNFNSRDPYVFAIIMQNKLITNVSASRISLKMVVNVNAQNHFS